MTTLATQYDNFATTFSAVHDEGENSNRDNRAVFYSHIDFVREDTRLLDVACGDGLDLLHYQELGAKISGIDASEGLLAIAQKRLPDADLHLGDFREMPYADATFDAVVSKHALQTAADMHQVFEEMHRVLKSGGTLLYLVTHPMRQFMERKNASGDYFTQAVVDSKILNNSLTVKEPTHTLNEYLSPWFFARFNLTACEERWDPAAEQIGDGKYPGYLIIKAVKR